VVLSLGEGGNGGGGGSTLETLAETLVALSRAVEGVSGELGAGHPLSERLYGTALELRRLADDVMRHSPEQELPAGIFDRLEQQLISAASMVFTPDRLRPA
jgi:hypothetical protein